jgi:hypothetical protein
MNKISFAAILIFLVACSQNSPKSVAEHFLKAYHKQDFKEAAKYGTEDTGKMLDMLKSFIDMMPDSMKNARDLKTEITSEKVEGNKAVYTYKEEGKDGEQVLNLVKVNDKWKVSMSKDNMNGSSNGLDAGGVTTDTAAVFSDTLK